MLRVHVLGELVVEESGHPVELSGSWRARSLLAWLALNPGTHLRGDLAPRFWPDVLDSSARASLRNALWALRRAFGSDSEALIATRDRVGLAEGPEVWVDAAAFAEHLAAGELEEALALCRGELLAGIEEEWVYEYREEHREVLSGLLESVAEKAEAADNLAGAIAHTRRRAALDPLAEDAQRALIGRLARSGDRAGALAAYERVRERFRREMGISVSEETRALAARIREGGTEGQASPAVPAPAVSAGPGTDTGGWEPGARFPLPPRLRQRASAALVGREGELETLRGLWASAAGGDGARCVLISGEAGIGKTRLARELALESEGQGAVVLHGAADEDLLVPHQPLVTALDHYIASASAAELSRRVHPRAADLEPIAPGLAAAAGAEAGTSTESRRYRLYEAFASLVGEVAGQAPVLLVVDDLHWADQSSVDILRHALESRPEMRVLVLATARETEIPAAGPLAEAMQRLLRAPYVERLPLTGLSAGDISLLAEGLSGRDLAAGLAHGIRQETGGNPFFVQEVVRDLSESGGAEGVLSLARADVPDRIREVLNLRLGRLSENCVRLLTVAAVLGVEFRVAPLEHVSDLAEDDLAAALDEAVAAAVILETEEGEHETFSFSHALVRRTLLERVSRAHRRRIHARVAEALRSDDSEENLLGIAHHLCEARPVSDREEALDFATRAAERATADLAYAEAVDLYTRARGLLRDEDPRRRTLALKRAVAYQALFHAVMDAGDGSVPTAG